MSVLTRAIQVAGVAKPIKWCRAGLGWGLVGVIAVAIMSWGAALAAPSHRTYDRVCGRSGQFAGWIESRGSLRESIQPVSNRIVELCDPPLREPLSSMRAMFEWSDCRRGDKDAFGMQNEDGFGWPLTAWYVKVGATYPVPRVQFGDARMYTQNLLFVKSVPGVFEPGPQSWRRGPDATRRVCLPLHPFIPGMIVDSAVMGFALAVLRRFSCKAIAIVRERRGRCASCGYELAGLVGSVCPECGCLVRKASNAATGA